MSFDSFVAPDGNTIVFQSFESLGKQFWKATSILQITQLYQR